MQKLSKSHLLPPLSLPPKATSSDEDRFFRNTDTGESDPRFLIPNNSVSIKNHHQEPPPRTMSLTEDMRFEVAEMLRGIERYNPENLSALEQYVDAQVAEDTYDLEANLAILKLYQFNPSCFKTEYVVSILLKALANLPHTDFILCKCLIDPQLMEELVNENIRTVMKFHNLLETCNFKEFWVELRKDPSIWQNISGFEDSIRKFICHVVNITYETISKATLCELLGSRDITPWLEGNKWTDRGEDVFIFNQEESIKTKNITEKIDLEGVAPIIAAYR